MVSGVFCTRLSESMLGLRREVFRVQSRDAEINVLGGKNWTPA
jgi:hypothetical protein